jgi:hypothetical protein
LARCVFRIFHLSQCTVDLFETTSFLGWILDGLVLGLFKTFIILILASLVLYVIYMYLIVPEYRPRHLLYLQIWGQISCRIFSLILTTLYAFFRLANAGYDYLRRTVHPCLSSIKTQCIRTPNWTQKWRRFDFWRCLVQCLYLRDGLRSTVGDHVDYSESRYSRCNLSWSCPPPLRGSRR